MAKDDVKNRQTSGSVRLIGDRGSGKTTYMASLARWPNANPDSPVQRVVNIGKESENLVTKAQNILEEGLELEPTRLSQDIKDYTLNVVLKRQFGWGQFPFGNGNKTQSLFLNCKDYSGEFFSDLVHSQTSSLQTYLEDCLEMSGIMLLLDGMSNRKDAEYAASLEKFLVGLDRANVDQKRYRIALSLAKCEQPELWINRHRPGFVASARFPNVYKILETWQEAGGGRSNYFMTSAFGCMGTLNPEPNAQILNRQRGGVTSILKYPKRWRPFGLVSPLYWLCTGKRHKQLDEE